MSIVTSARQRSFSRACFVQMIGDSNDHSNRGSSGHYGNLSEETRVVTGQTARTCRKSALGSNAYGGEEKIRSIQDACQYYPR